MAPNVHVTRIDANPIMLKQPSTTAIQSHRKITSVPQNYLNPTLTLISVPEDRNIRKYPVRIFEMQPEE